ncbi:MULTISPECIES: error-prone DNA polymerase [unclassified Amycolatopsis]|uniref:error-prone DNA polymerase n=1 Tax=unclassified Amycolatopsis TaxID=2618356 RepID=UPI0028769A12|nr:error-prone DNA polymerase [Amycolatopsis sp. 505]MDS0149189.1 error-prone DNA polymerase [Amycolatopsis sp. CM201R]
MSVFNGGAGRSWRELERIASGRGPAVPRDGGDSPAWSRKRDGYRPPEDVPTRRSSDDGAGERRRPYAELHVHSYFSFLDGVSSPETLVEEAARLGLDAVMLTDHDGMYGAVRFATAARELGIRAGYGAELSLGLSAPQAGVPDPAGTHLLMLARDSEGYRRLCRVISHAQLAGEEKGRPVYDVAEVVDELAGHVQVLTGCRKGAVRQALVQSGPAAAADELALLVDRFGRDHVAVELIDHRQPLDSTHNDHLAAMAKELTLPTVVSNNVHYARPEDSSHADAVAAIRARRSVEELEGWLPAAGMAYLRSGAEQLRAFERRYPGAVARAALLGVECSFDLALVAPKLPPFPCPPGFADEDAYLRDLVMEGAAARYGTAAEAPEAYAQLEHELTVIRQLGFPGYFLVVWDIVRFCRERGILAQGRGSAANSAVCFALFISHCDPVRWGLLFERFLAPERDGPPDIDVDIESDRREEAIQYVYERHGRLHAAQVANVITYRARSAVRDAAKALGHSPGQQDAFAKAVDRWHRVADADTPGERGHGVPDDVRELAARLEDTPRHLGVHSGGMVIAHTPVSEIVPVEWATKKDRTVLQWDKDDCAEIGLVKFDLLGLGMLSALRYSVDLVAQHHDREVDLGELDLADPAVYDMLCEADAIGVFQVESRAQLGTLPRLRPRKFYDLVVEVALIRPGPIQGGSVHPYIRRRRGEEAWSHAHPLLADSLDRTLGVPLFQEQVMQMARDVASFTAAEADQLRRAMGAKRSGAKMHALMARFFAGCEANGIERPLAERIFEQIHAFSGYGFPEAHSMSFALLVYASAWFKRYYPAAFCAGLLRAQPMGFYSPQSLVADARRHGVLVREPDINTSLVHATLEPETASTGGVALRLGLAGIRQVGTDVAEAIVAERNTNGPFGSIGELTERVQLKQPVAEALATAGAFAALGPDRRQALWAAGAAARTRDGHLPGIAAGVDAPALPGMTALEVAAADVWATGITPDRHPVQFVREHLDALGVVPAARVLDVVDRSRIKVGGAVTHKQRPATAGGITFLNLEDETGMINVVVHPSTWTKFRQILATSSALVIRGQAQVTQGTASVVADQITPLDLRALAARSRDFR